MKLSNVSALEPYPEMKDSGVEWIGRIPEHWETRRLGSLGHFSASGIDKHTVAGEPLVRMVNYVDIYKNTTSELHASRNYQVVSCPQWKKEIHGVKRGDLLFTPSSETPDEIGLSAVCMHDLADTIYSYHVIRFRPILAMDLRFKKYWCNNRSVLDQFSSCCKGTTRHILTRNDFRSIWVSVPPPPEQTAIGCFLDHADRRIRRYIRAKQKLIALLEDQKQAIIHQAVTGQTDVRTGRPYPAYRDSGLKWLGDVPEHWEVLPLKRAFVSMEYGISDSGSDAGTIGLLTMGNIRDGKVTVPRYGGVASVDTNLLLQDKDLLFNRTNSSELVAKVGLFSWEGRPVTFASYLVRMRTRPENSPEFLNLLLNDVGFLAIARREAIPSLHQSNLNPTRYGRLKIPLPPPSEQEAIVQVVTNGISGVNAAVVRTNREIDHLREYLTRLIVDVVTGKLDMREAAAGLPEEDVPGDAEESAEEYTSEHPPM